MIACVVSAESTNDAVDGIITRLEDQYGFRAMRWRKSDGATNHGRARYR